MGWDLEKIEENVTTPMFIKSKFEEKFGKDCVKSLKTKKDTYDVIAIIDEKLITFRVYTKRTVNSFLEMGDGSRDLLEGTWIHFKVSCLS